MNVCKDCLYVHGASNGEHTAETWTCGSPYQPRSPLTFLPIVLCSLARSSAEMCGPAGGQFEERNWRAEYAKQRAERMVNAADEALLIEGLKIMPRRPVRVVRGNV